jgi:hypothetical protein
MDSHAMFLNCPAYMDKDGGARCGLPAEVEYRYTMNSTDGPLESAKISCPRRHHFNAPIDTSLCQSSRPRPPHQPARRQLRPFKAHHRTPDGRENDHNTADMGQLPAGPAVPVGLGWHPAADNLAAVHAYLPAQAALATDGEPETGPGHHLSSAGGPAKNHPPTRRATGRSAR